MATNNISILFWLHKSKLNKKGEAPLNLRVTYNNMRKNISSGYRVALDKWDSRKGIVKGGKEVTNLINGYISQSKTKLMELSTEMVKDGDIDLDLLVDRFLNRNLPCMTLMELVRHHNMDFGARIGIDYAQSTLAVSFEKLFFILASKAILQIYQCLVFGQHRLFGREQSIHFQILNYGRLRWIVIEYF
jgi:hypothetical protein